MGVVVQLGLTKSLDGRKLLCRLGSCYVGYVTTISLSVRARLQAVSEDWISGSIDGESGPFT